MNAAAVAWTETHQEDYEAVFVRSATGNVNLELEVPIRGNAKGMPRVNRLPEMIYIPKFCRANITFSLADDVAPDWNFSKFVISPLAPLSDASDFSVDTLDSISTNTRKKEFVLGGREFTLMDKNNIKGFFKYDLAATDGSGREEVVDPGIGNGGQN